MFGLVEFFGGPAWSAAVALGAILAILAGIDASAKNFRDRAFYITFWLALYFLAVLFIRGVAIFISSL